MPVPWALWASVAMALSLGHVMLDEMVNRESVGAGLSDPEPAGLPADRGLFLGSALVNLILFAGWAYLMALAGREDREAFAALAFYAGLWGLGQGGLTIVLAPPGANGVWEIPATVIHLGNLTFGAAATFLLSRHAQLGRAPLDRRRIATYCLPLALAIVYHAGPWG